MHQSVVIVVGGETGAGSGEAVVAGGGRGGTLDDLAAGAWALEAISVSREWYATTSSQTDNMKSAPAIP